MAEVDRGTSESREHNEQRPRVLMVTLIVALLFAASLSLLPSPSSDVPPTPVPAGISYTSHVTISINGNAQFNNSAYPNNGVVSGNGTALNPYIIEGWDINAASGHGISIQNANAYFAVKDCSIHDGTATSYGIYLYAISNGTVSNNTFSNNAYGIRLSSSSNNTIRNNTISSGYARGIYLLDSSNYNILTNNTCLNTGYSIQLTSSSNNTISNNRCLNSNRAIYLYSSSNYNTIDDNNCSNTLYNGIFLENSNNGNTLSNNICKSAWYGIMISGLPSYKNIIVNNTCNLNNFYGIMLGQGGNNIVRNNSCNSNNQYGIVLQYSSKNNIVSNNTCNSNIIHGIYLDSVNNNIISWNQACNNTQRGVCIGSGSNNRMWNNTFIGNNGAGSIYDSGHIQAYDDGSNNWWNSTNGYGNYWADWTTPDVIPRFGIVDLPYNITGTAGAKDYYPLTSPKVSAPPIPEFSEIVIPIVGLMLIALVFGRTGKKP
jgi:parallel beta-helix repeat protein